jgi:hypothetical protein
MDKEIDDAFDRLWAEEFLKDAEMQQDTLFNDEDMDNCTITDEEVKTSYGRLVERLKAEGIYEEYKKIEVKKLPEKEGLSTPVVRRTRSKRQEERRLLMAKINVALEEEEKRRKSKFSKVAGIIIVSGLIISGLLMVQSADKQRISEAFQYLSQQEEEKPTNEADDAMEIVAAKTANIFR